MKKILFTVLFIFLFATNVFANEPEIHYIFNEDNVKNSVVADLSGNGNNGKTDGKVRTDGEYEGETIDGTVEIPVEPFLNSNSYTWIGKFKSVSNLPSVLSISSSAGKIEVSGAGGSGMPRMLSYRVEDYINNTSVFMQYGGGIFQNEFFNFALVHDENGFMLYWNGERPEMSYAENEKCSATITQILSGENPKIELYCDNICMTEFMMYNTALSAEEIKENARQKTSVSINDGKASVTVPIDIVMAEHEDTALYFAEYSRGKLCGVKKVARDDFVIDKYGCIEVEYQLSKADSTVKCFVWKGKIEILN